MSENGTTQGMVKSDETLFAIIEGLRALDGAGVTELANHLDMAKSAVHKHLKTLEYHGYVVKHDNVYRLSFSFLVLGGYARHRNKLCRLAGPKVRDVAKQLGVVATFSVEENGRGVVVHQANELPIDVRSHIGTEFDLHIIAPGKALLARLSDERIREIIDRRGLYRATERTIGSVDDLMEEIHTIRDRGYAISIEEGVEGEASIGVAVEHPESGTLAALAISCPVTESARAKLETEYAERLFETVSELRYQLSG